MHRLASFALAAVLAATALAQSPATFSDPANLRGERVSPSTGRELPLDKGTLGLEQLLRKLNTRASILNIVAHPDDEDGGMLTLYARGYGARVADLSLTRGEGGQNAMTADFEDALGLLRTQELLANDRYTGVSQMFGTEVDFGFSKTKAESFAKWTHQRVLYDAVRAIRLYRPLVITATFIGNPTDGHGQHQVSGEIAQEAFVAAGDPNVFPELTKEGILPWQPLKMYARVPTYAISNKGLFDYATNQYVPATFTNYITGKTSTIPPTADITIHEGTTDPLLTTCAANPSDLPNALRQTTSSLSSFRNAGGSASPTADCRPLSYVQFARIGLGLQRTQIGPGVRNAPSGPFDVPYHLYGSRGELERQRRAPYQPGAQPQVNAKDEPRAEGPLYSPALASQPTFFDGIDTSIEGIADLAPQAFPSDLLSDVARGIHAATEQFDPKDPDNIAPALAASLKDLDQLIAIIEKWNGDPIQKENALHELRIKRVQLNDALILALGLSIEAPATTADLLSQTASVTDILREESSQPVDYVRGWSADSFGNGLGDGKASDGPPVWSVSKTHPLTRNCDLSTSGTEITRPYFTRTDIEKPVYDLLIPELRNAPSTPPAFTCGAEVNFQGIPLQLGVVVTHLRQPVNFVPALSVAARPSIGIISTESAIRPVEFNVTVLTNLPRMKPRTELSMPENWKITTPERDFTLSQPGDSRTIAVSVLPNGVIHRDGHIVPTTISVCVMNSESKDRVGTDLGYRSVGYGDLPRTNYYTPAAVRIVPVDLQLPPADKRRIAYLPGTGDDVPAALASIGLNPTILTVADLTPEKLSNFDTIILGVRTYNAHPDLHGAPTAALLAFARNGGNVLVQYQTAEFTAADAPFPLELGRSAEKVIDETAPVQLLDTNSPLLTTPNRITSADFNNWIEERGHGFLSSWDPHYTALTETHDPGQAPQRGGLLTVQLSRGHWTYCAFALYRQLPEAVPGGYRLFTNMLGLADQR